MEITIDLASPLTIGIITGVILMAIAGAWNFAKILFSKQIIEKKFFTLFSEVESLHKKYKDKISNINETHKIESDKAIDDIRKLYDKKLEEILKHNKPPSTGRILMDRSKLEEMLTKKNS